MSLSRRVPPRNRPVAFALLTALMLAIAAGHLYVVAAYTAVLLGLPVWIWLQLGVVAVLLALAWVTTDLVTPEGVR